MMTNKDKFMQVFGEEPDTDVCPIGCRTDCPCFSKCSPRAFSSSDVKSDSKSAEPNSFLASAIGTLAKHIIAANKIKIFFIC